MYLNRKLQLQQLENRITPALTFFQDSGTVTSDISDTVNQFRSILGNLNPNQAGSFGVGRREINWDGVPAQFASPNAFPADFFNVTSPRGVVFSTSGTGFQVSGNTNDSGTGQPTLEFANLNANYPTLFNPFSAQRLFTSVGDNEFDVTFFVPGTNTPAITRAFGIVFSDVDNAGTTIVQYFDANGNSLFGGAVSPTFPATNGGLSFLGAFDNETASIARVRITLGNTTIGADEVGSTDIVVVDDFIFAEPIAAPAAPTISNISNQTITSGNTLGPIAFTVNDVNTPASQLNITATSSNPALVANNNISFGGNGTNRSVFVLPNAGQSGTTTITVTVTDGDGQTATDTFTLTVNAPTPSPPTPPTPPTPVDLFAVATGAGIPVQVNVFEANGNLRFSLRPFGSFAGGATVATGDVTGDGTDDILVGAGSGGAPHIKVFDGATGAQIRSFLAYGSTFSGGIFVGLGDVTGDGRADIITGSGAGGGPHVKVFNGTTNALIFSFFAFSPTFTGGVSVRGGDINGDGRADIVVGAGPGGGPHVKIFSGVNLNLISSFFAGNSTDTSGVLVGVGDFLNNSRPEVVASVNGRVRVFGTNLPAGPINGIIPFIEQENIVPFQEGIVATPAAVRLNNGIIAILVGAAPGPGSKLTSPHVKIVDGTSNTIRSFFAFDANFLGGVFVG
jgi:hypothetical protein